MTETVVTVNSHQPSNTAPSSGGGGLSWVRINLGYFQTLPGIVKIVQFILGILCMALASPAYIGATHFFLFVVVVSFIATILWSFAYLLGVREGLTLPFNWILTELINTGIEAVLYFIAFIVQLAKWSELAKLNRTGYSSNIAAGVFGLFNFLAYAAGSYLLYIEHRRGSTQ